MCPPLVYGLGHMRDRTLGSCASHKFNGTWAAAGVAGPKTSDTHLKRNNERSFPCFQNVMQML